MALSLDQKYCMHVEPWRAQRLEASHQRYSQYVFYEQGWRELIYFGRLLYSAKFELTCSKWLRYSNEATYHCHTHRKSISDQREAAACPPKSGTYDLRNI